MYCLFKKHNEEKYFEDLLCIFYQLINNKFSNESRNFKYYFCVYTSLTQKENQDHRYHYRHPRYH